MRRGALLPAAKIHGSIGVNHMYTQLRTAVDSGGGGFDKTYGRGCPVLLSCDICRQSRSKLTSATGMVLGSARQPKD